MPDDSPILLDIREAAQAECGKAAQHRATLTTTRWYAAVLLFQSQVGPIGMMTQSSTTRCVSFGRPAPRGPMAVPRRG